MAVSADQAPGVMVPMQSFRPRPLLLVIDGSQSAAQLSNRMAGSVDVRLCASGAEGLLVAGSTRPDVVLAGTGLTDVPYRTLVELLRRNGTPVIVGTDTEHGHVAGIALQAGAAACIAHPYRPDEVLALVRSLGSTSAAASDPELRCGSLVLDPGGHTVRLRDAVVDMPPQEFRVLQFLMVHQGRVVSRAQLWEAVWGGKGPAASNTIAVHIRRLRTRLGDDPSHPEILTTVGRSGYRLQPPRETPVAAAARSPLASSGDTVRMP